MTFPMPFWSAAMFVGVLDGISVVPAAAYSLRRLRGGYGGPAVRVRRSSDSAEQDIGFVSAGALDTAALSAFVGSNSGFVTTWYDQSGNGRNMVQATAASQPRLVNAGSLDQIGSRPAIYTTTGLSAAQSTNAGLIAGNSDRTLIGVMSRISGDHMCIWSGQNASNGAFGIDFASDYSYVPYTFGAGDTTSAVIAVGTATVATAVRASGVSSGYKNGTLAGTNSAAISTVNSSNLGIGVRPGGAVSTGWYADVLYFGSALSTSDRQTIERNIGAYHGITVA